MELLSNMVLDGKVGFYANVYGDNIVYDSKGMPLLTQEALLNNLDDTNVVNVKLSENSYQTNYQIPASYYLMLAHSGTLVQLKEITDVSNYSKY